MWGVILRTLKAGQLEVRMNFFHVHRIRVARSSRQHYDIEVDEYAEVVAEPDAVHRPGSAGATPG